MTKRFRWILVGLIIATLAVSLVGCSPNSSAKSTRPDRPKRPTTTTTTEPPTTTTTVPEPYPTATLEIARPDGLTVAYTPFQGSQWKLAFSKNLDGAPPGFANITAQVTRPDQFPGTAEMRSTSLDYPYPTYWMPVRWDLPVAPNTLALAPTIYDKYTIGFDNSRAAANCVLTNGGTAFACDFSSEHWRLQETSFTISTSDFMLEAAVDSFLAAVSASPSAPTVDVNFGFDKRCTSYYSEGPPNDIYMREPQLTIRLRPGQPVEVLNPDAPCQWPFLSRP